MPQYVRNSEKNTMIKLDLPSAEGACSVWVPSRLGFGIRREIQSMAMTTKLVDPTPDEIREAEAAGVEPQPTPQLFFDPTKAAGELLVRSFTDKRSYHNIVDENDRPIIITRHWVENEMDEDDAMFLAQILLRKMWDQVGAAAPEGEPEEGDSPLASPETSPETTATDGEAKQRSRRR